MTYLDVVNRILKRLRERTVGTVNQTQYSTLIGIFVNDAKTAVEEAWRWTALRSTLTAVTTPGIFNYELNGAKNNFLVLDVINDTENISMQYRDTYWFNRVFKLATPQSGAPVYYNFNGVSSDGDTQVDLYPIPDAAYDIRFNLILRTPMLTDDSARIEVPAHPIELLAYAMAVEERGEDGGFNPVTAYAMANRALSDAVALDSAQHPEEVTWVAP